MRERRHGLPPRDGSDRLTTYAFPPPPIPTVAIDGEAARFPVRRIFCVGRNYAEHAREMGGNPDREKPFFFSKPADAVVESGATIPYPPETRDLHHEIEMVVAIGGGGFDVPPAQVEGLILGYAVGIDLTRRDLQAEAKKAGRPWDWAKGFDRSAPIGAIRRADKTGHPSSGRIWLAVNETIKQDAGIGELIWSVPELVAAISRSMALRPGDLIMTGTPAGVGPVQPGDVLTGGVDGIGAVRVTIGR